MREVSCEVHDSLTLSSWAGRADDRLRPSFLLYHRLAIGEDDPYLGWSPDGETLIFVATNGLYEVSANGDALVRIGPGRFDGQLVIAPDEERRTR